ncbi:hypothetical protein GS400_19535 [Pontibacillus sp. HMF3514]|nr:hypothetical protein GS400_19535 [Pontibacillus sp. HMF3514]
MEKMEERMYRKTLIFGILCSILMLLTGFSHPGNKQHALWVKQADLNTETEDILQLSKKRELNQIYLKINRQKTYDYYETFIRKANEAGIDVYAFGGKPSWGLKENNYESLSFAYWVKDYNNSVAENAKMTGVIFKVLPYKLQAWTENKTAILKQWKNNMQAAYEEAKLNSSLKVSVAMPFWLDSIETPGESNMPFSTWLIRQFDQTAVLAYRDTMEGPNGVVALTEDELKAANEYNKDIMIGVSLENSGNDVVSFHGEGVDDMYMHLDVLDKHVTQSSYVGTAIDDFQSWLQLSPLPEEEVETSPKEDKEESSESPQDEQKRGTYIWHASNLISEPDQIIQFAKEKDLNMLYTRLDLRQPFSKYQDFMEKAQEAGIEVHAMGGHPKWALEDLQPRIMKLVNYVKKYNGEATSAQKFDGIHIDVEPYTVNGWNRHNDEKLKEWMDNIKLFVKESKEGTDLEVSMDLAMWWDDRKTPGNPDLPFNKWVMKQMDHTSVMAFRDYAEGPGGILYMTEEEVKHANNLGKPIVLSLEMRPSLINKITFAEEGKAKMREQIDAMETNLQDESSYEGYMIHSYEYWKEAKE